MNLKTPKMKHIEIKELLKKDLLIAELPEGWIFNTYKDQIGFCNEINKPITQIKGSYTLLGKPDDISEEDAAELVEHHETLGFRSYKSNSEFPINTYIHKTATESLLSAIESVIFWENPYSGVLASEFPTVFEKFESLTFDRNRSIILVKN